MNAVIESPEVLTISLEFLLSESLAAKAASDKEKDMRKRLNSGRMGQEEAAETQTMLRQWDNKREWKRTSNVVVFARQQCKCCGSYHTTFEGYFEGYTSTRLQNTTKMESVKFFELDLPKQTKYHDAIVPVCHACAELGGWELEEE